MNLNPALHPLKAQYQQEKAKIERRTADSHLLSIAFDLKIMARSIKGSQHNLLFEKSSPKVRLGKVMNSKSLKQKPFDLCQPTNYQHKAMRVLNFKIGGKF